MIDYSVKWKKLFHIWHFQYQCTGVRYQNDMWRTQRSIVPEHREKAKVAVSRYSLPCPNQPCRRMGPSLACPDVSDETPERDGDIGSILDSRCRQISRPWMLQQLLFSNEHQSWPALKLRRVFAQHFLSFGVFSWRRGPTLANIVSGGNGILARMVCYISVAEICPI